MTRWLPIVAAAFLLAACDNSNDEPPVAPQVGADVSSSSSAADEKLVTGPRGPAQTLPQVAVPPAPADSGRDSAATKPKEELTKHEEQNTMPKAGQANNYMSEALSKPEAGGDSSSQSGSSQGGSAQGGTTQGGSAQSGTAQSGSNASTSSQGDSVSASSQASAPTQLAQSGGASSPAGGSSSSNDAAAGAAAAGAAGAAAAGGAAKPVSQEQALALMKKHNCASCHAVDKKLIGPTYKEVAEKYKGDASAEDKLIDKVVKGGSGVWGPVPMPPHPTVPKEDIQAIVDWILAGAN